MVHVSEFKRPPWVDTSKLGEAWKIPVFYGLNKAATGLVGHFREHRIAEQRAGRRANMLYILERLTEAAAEKWTEQEYKGRIQDMFGQFMVQYQFMKGSSNIERFYTVHYRGHEVPVFAQAKGSAAPTQEALQHQVEEVIRTGGVSPLNDKLSALFRHDFIFAVNQYMRGDYGQFIDPGKASEWLPRDDGWIIQQYGQQTIEAGGQQHRISSFNRASPLKTWLYWSVGDKLYDAVDIIFDPVQRVLETAIEKGVLPDKIRQVFTEQEYKGIAAIRRAIFSSGRPSLEFDLTGPGRLDAPVPAGGAGGAHGGGHGHYGYRALQELYEEGVGRN